MTLLGVGNTAVGVVAPGGSSTLGRIGSGYIYADWKGQVSYSTPNFNGFQATAGVMENFGAANQNKQHMAYEGKVTYDFAAGDVNGRIWVSGITQKSTGTAAVAAVADSATAQGTSAVAAGQSYTSNGWDIGAKASMGPATIVGYYYDGKGLDGQNGRAGGLFNDNGVKSDDDGGYVQGTVVVPHIGTKVGASWGVSNSKHTASAFDIENESWIIGAYHPLTKHLNLVAEYVNNEIKDKAAGSKAKQERDTVSLGAILFF
jgi:predicted porin